MNQLDVKIKPFKWVHMHIPVHDVYVLSRCPNSAEISAADSQSDKRILS